MFRLEVLPRQERNIHTLIVLVDLQEDPTSTSKREEMLLQVVVHTPKLEDTPGQQNPSEDTEPALEDADSSDMLPERRRMVTDKELKLARWFQSDHDANRLNDHIRNRIIINMTSLHYNTP